MIVINVLSNRGVTDKIWSIPMRLRIWKRKNPMAEMVDFRTDVEWD